MIFIFGKRLYGRVDDVPGLFYVKTSFLHFDYVPLIPVGSFLIFDGTETDNGFQGVKIGISLKSILATWLRAALVIGGIVCAVGAVTTFTDAVNRDPFGGAKMLLWSAAFFIGYWVSRRYAHANVRRALRLAGVAGIPEELVQARFASAGAALDSQASFGGTAFRLDSEP